MICEELIAILARIGKAVLYRGRMPARTLLIVYQSRTGGTRQMAEAAATAAGAEPDITVRLLVADDADGADLLAADGCIFAAPENLEALAGRMKDFFDSS